MNMRKLTLGLVGSIALVFGIVLLRSSNEEAQYEPRTKKQTVYETTVGGAADWLANRRINQETGIVDIKDVDNAKKQVAALRSAKNGIGLQWEDMGPTNIGGRCRAVLIDKDVHSTMYAGGVSGGLWKSTTSGNSWQQVIYAGDAETSNIPNLIISSIAQDAAGTIYFGTGEGFYIGYGTGSRGFDGAGMWKSTDGETFTRIASTWSDGQSKNTFKFVNEIVAHPTQAGKIFAATAGGLKVSEDSGNTWTSPINSSDFCQDVKISVDGQVVICNVGVYDYVSHDGGASFQRIAISSEVIGTTVTPSKSARTEFAIAPSNSNVIYAQCSKADGSLLNIYRSEDKGITWSIIGPGGGNAFNPLGTQGTFDNIITVYPDNENEIILGGQYSLWRWQDTEGWNKLTDWFLPPTATTYVHADHHALIFHPTNPDIIYCGSDGGISASTDGGYTWQTKNKYFNITQFYAIANGPNRELIGGTQDNGTIYTNPDMSSTTTGTSHEFYEVGGGDGGYSEISNISPNIIFSTVYYGALYRSDEYGTGESNKNFYSENLLSDVANLYSAPHPFVTPIALWESFYDDNSIDSTYRVFSENIDAGVEVPIESNVSGKYYYHTLSEPVLEGDTVKIRDTYQALFATGFHESVWVTRDAINMSKTAEWAPIIEFSNETTTSLEWSKDGDILYIITDGNGGSLYRVSGFIENRTVNQMDIGRSEYGLTTAKIANFPGRNITGISVDPQDAGKVVITLGNYGATDFIYYSTTADEAAAITNGTGTFVAKQGDLPQMPVYDALVLWNDSDKVIVGTEFGVYATSNISSASPSWSDENANGFDYVPTYSLRQQTHENGWINEINADSGVRNHGIIWAGTHGRGIFKCSQFAGPVNIENTVTTRIEKNMIEIYPNPAVSDVNFNIKLDEKAKVIVYIYDIQGRLVDQVNYNNLNSGQHTKQYNCSALKSGTYIVRMTANSANSTSRLIVK